MKSPFVPSQLRNHSRAITECAVSALIANHELREAFLGDLAEEFARTFPDGPLAGAFTLAVT